MKRLLIVLLALAGCASAQKSPATEPCGVYECWNRGGMPGGGLCGGRAEVCVLGEAELKCACWENRLVGPEYRWVWRACGEPSR